MKIEGSVVLITGASRGIGAAAAAEFARAGAKLSLTARDSEALGKVAPADALITAGDITKEAVREQIVARTLHRFGTIDILINNAGAGLYGPSWKAGMGDIRWLMELNFFAPVAMVQQVVPHMRAQRTGMIVNVGSIAGKIPLPWMSLYSTSKYALGAWTESLRMELKRDGIHTMIVCPGYVTTEFQNNARGGRVPEKVVRGRRLAITAEQCAKAIRRGVERNARTVLTPAGGWLLVAAMRSFPGFVEARLAGMIQSE
ncbi:MAG: SDR family NAD(P)-dependent oxidoreductase [Acidobacteriia bacterium]|nr:SDR family NAD(P)-dependent oxidoreductase [Terriglobia bacterium]